MNYFPKYDFTFATYELSTLPPFSLESKCPQKRSELSWNCNMHKLCLLSFKVIHNPSLIQCSVKIRIEERRLEMMWISLNSLSSTPAWEMRLFPTLPFGFFFLHCGLSCIQLLKFIKFYLLWITTIYSLVCFPGLPLVQPSPNNAKADSSLLGGTFALSKSRTSRFEQRWLERWKWSFRVLY